MVLAFCFCLWRCFIISFLLAVSFISIPSYRYSSGVFSTVCSSGFILLSWISVSILLIESLYIYSLSIYRSCFSYNSTYNSFVLSFVNLYSAKISLYFVCQSSYFISWDISIPAAPLALAFIVFFSLATFYNIFEVCLGHSSLIPGVES